jgi:O-antigen/teichoic acid export membrane protein
MKRRATLYLVVAFTQKAVGFIMLPLFVRSMPADDYGAVSLIVTIAALVAALIGGPIEQAVFRWSVPSRSKSDSARALVGLAARYLRYGVPLALTAVALGLAASGASPFGIDGVLWAIELVAISLTISVTYYAFPRLRAVERLRAFMALAAVMLVGTVACKLGFVVSLGAGVSGWVFADMAVAVVTYLVARVLVDAPKSRQKLRRQAKTLWRFSAPLTPHVASFWILSSSNRTLMAFFVPLSAVGTFSAAANIFAVGVLVLGEINRATLNIYASRDATAAPRIRALNTYQAFFAQLVAFLMIVASLLTAPLLFPPGYEGVLPPLCILSVGLIGYGWYLIPTNELVHRRGDTRAPWLASLTGALVAAVGTVITAPTLGPIGVAAMTSCAYFSMWLMAMIIKVRRAEEVPSGRGAPSKIFKTSMACTTVAIVAFAVLSAVSAPRGIIIAAGVVATVCIVIGAKVTIRRVR